MKYIKLPAIRISQGVDKYVYSFAVDGKIIPSFADISRISRNSGKNVEGYQRPQIQNHISEIRSYLESTNPMLPNSVVIAFDDTVTFEGSNNGAGTSDSLQGYISIPIPDGSTSHKPGWVVDGQQRISAIDGANIKSFMIFATAFIAANEKEHSEQFILVNSTKPLSKGLIYELLPGTDTKLPTMLERKKFPAYLLEQMNYRENSPTFRFIQMPTNPTGIIKDNSMLRMIENSLLDGALYRYRDSTNGQGDSEKMLELLSHFWGSVKIVFDDAWGLPPRQSRMLHGVGVISLGYIMDAIVEDYDFDIAPTSIDFETKLSALKKYCMWTEGYWDFSEDDRRPWNQLQNVSRDIQILADYLLTRYRKIR